MESSTDKNPKTEHQEEEEEEEEFTIELVKDMSAEQENDLLSFLKKVQNSCKNDSSVPDFVAPQVNEWLKELIEKGKLEE
jgi:hypothetical protein